MASRARKADRHGAFSGNRVERAIIDIGSNTVRLVLYGGSPRAPVTLFNEKVAAQLGREIAQTGRLADEAIELAMRGLRRFALLLRDLKIEKIDVVATAASRDASNGAEFLQAVTALGFEPRLLSGEDEARISAMGILGAFPGASGLVADLGGGSLELVRIGEDAVGRASSLPLGTLRLPDHSGETAYETRRNLAAQLSAADWIETVDGTLYLVGGTWRSMAVFAMEDRGYPLTDPHGFELGLEDGLYLADNVAGSDPAELRDHPRISSMRSATLPAAGILLRVLLEKFRPRCIVFSSWGLREGILYDELEDFAKNQDPLLAGVGEFAFMRGAPPMLATRVAAWTVDAVPATSHGSERVRLAATMLALAAMQIEPNLRIGLATDWAMQKRWIALEPDGRAMMAAAVAANGNHYDLPPEVRELATPEQLEEATCWGLAIRLCWRLGGRSDGLFNVSKIEKTGTDLVLSLEEGHSDLFGIPSEKDLDLLAKRLKLNPKVQFVTASQLAESKSRT